MTAADEPEVPTSPASPAISAAAAAGVAHRVVVTPPAGSAEESAALSDGPTRTSLKPAVSAARAVLSPMQ